MVTSRNKFIILILLAILGFNMYVFVTGKMYVYKALIYNFADIDDYKLFENRIIEKGKTPQAWQFSSSYNVKPLPDSSEVYHNKLESVAFIIVKNDSIVYEKYWKDYNEKSLTNSFSIAKSILNILVGVALKEGKIKSLDQKISDFIPEFKVGKKNKVSIRDLLNMSSGLSWDESYSNPFSKTTEAYYGTNLNKLVIEQESIEEPNKIFRYLSGNSQLISIILKTATGKSISEYAQEKLWNPIGAEQNALWCIDAKDGDEKAYCCFNSNARDFSRLGKLYLNQGSWDGYQIVDTSFVKASITPNGTFDPLTNQKNDFYGLHWWVLPNYKGLNIFYARGILGQYVVVIPSKKLIITRLGLQKGILVGNHYSDMLKYIDMAIEFTK